MLYTFLFHSSLRFDREMKKERKKQQIITIHLKRGKTKIPSAVQVNVSVLTINTFILHEYYINNPILLIQDMKKIGLLNTKLSIKTNNII